MGIVEGRRRTASRMVVTGGAVLALMVIGGCRTPGDEAGGGASETDVATSTTAPSAPDATDPTEAGSDDDGFPLPDGTLPDVSDAVIPACGEAMTPPDRPSEVVIGTGPDGPVAARGGGWDADMENTADEHVQGYVTAADVVVVDTEGRVVGLPDPGFGGAEGPTWVSVAAGERILVPLDVPTACDGGDWLPPGEYEAYGALTFVADDGSLEQAQGGPWPLVLTGDDGGVAGYVAPEGGVPTVIECGETWADVEPATGLGIELLDPIREQRTASDPVEGRLVVVGETGLRTPVFSEVVVLRDGVVVDQAQGTDSLTTAVTSPWAATPLDFAEPFVDCGEPGAEPGTLPRGEYEVVVLVATITPGQDGVTVIAATDPVDVSLS